MKLILVFVIMNYIFSDKSESEMATGTWPMIKH